MTRLAILDPFSGIAGDMTLGALVGLGLDQGWLRALPERLGLPDVRVEIREVLRGEIVCWKVDFQIPPQPHGRHIAQIREMVARTDAPASVKEKADAAFWAIAEAEGEIHGMPPAQVHLHEVGAVDAILDIVGSIWGFSLLGVEQVRCGPLRTGDGTVRAAHGILPVPAPATLRLLEGHVVRPGPDGAGELVTPTGAALVRVLSSGPPPDEYIPRGVGYGAGTKDFPGRANALRILLVDSTAEPHNMQRQPLVVLASDIDDMSPEYLAAFAEEARAQAALDVVLLPVNMKKGRQGTRVELLCEPADAARLEALLLTRTSAIGVRRTEVTRLALPREEVTVTVLGAQVRLKQVQLPDGTNRMKPEFEDIQRLALATGRRPLDIYHLALATATPAARPTSQETSDGSVQ